MKLSQSIVGKLSELATRKPNLFSELDTTVSEWDYQLMCKASFELLKLIGNPEYQEALLKHKPEVARYSPGNLSAMIGVDFHITEEGPKIIEINTNAGGLVTSALWAYRNDEEKLEQVLQKMVAMFEAEYQQWQAAGGVKAELDHIAIIDKDPESEFTYDDFLLMASVFQQAGYRVSIGKTGDLTINDGKVYLPGSNQAIDLIYNRDCDFYLQENHSQVLKEVYLQGLACVTPNAYGYGLLSDKFNLALISELLRRETAEDDYPALAEVFLPTLSLESFLKQGINRNDWYFKPINEHAGKGVYRGKKLSQKRLSEFSVADYIVQQEALPALINWQDESFKYDIRLFVYEDIIEIYSRVYQGRITNFRSEKGGYSKVSVVADDLCSPQ